MGDLDDMMAWEAGELDDGDTVDLFQRLVNNGMAWRLQGAYGWMATELLDAGMITSPFQVVADSDDDQ